jgi:hypothetical protein
MSLDTRKPSSRPIKANRLTTRQLLAAAEQDTDAVSMFGGGTCEADTDVAILVVKGAENIAYLRGILVRQGMLTEGKAVVS